MANFLSNTPGLTAANAGIGSLDSTRRLFNFGDRVSELAPEQTPFFVYLSRVAKKATDDPTFKFLEQRHQWQRRNFYVGDAIEQATYVSGTTTKTINLCCLYDKQGNVATETAPEFLLNGQIIVIADSAGVARRFRIEDDAIDINDTVANATQVDIKALFSAADVTLAADGKGQVIGSSFAEATSYPEGWADELYAREGYTQIFKTAMPLMSGTAQATRYKGIANEWQRVWKEKLMEHKMDVEQAMLFGEGSNSTPTHRQTWGILPYIETYGKNYTMDWDGGDKGAGYAANQFFASYDGLLSMFEDFFTPEGGNSCQKLALESRSVITWFNKLGGFVSSTAGTDLPFNLDVNYKDGRFGHKIMEVNTIYGQLNLIQEPLFRGPFDNLMMLVDMNNVAYRPLQGNGINRDTYIETNVQSPGMDGRVDQILTEAGLEISLPETHALVKFTDVA